jgi:hypothetical protein
MAHAKTLFRKPVLVLKFLIVCGTIVNKFYEVSATTVDMLIVLRLLMTLQDMFGQKILIILNAIYSSLKVLVEMFMLMAIFLFFFSETGKKKRKTLKNRCEEGFPLGKFSLLG